MPVFEQVTSLPRFVEKKEKYEQSGSSQTDKWVTKLMQIQDKQPKPQGGLGKAELRSQEDLGLNSSFMVYCLCDLGPVILPLYTLLFSSLKWQ